MSTFDSPTASPPSSDRSRARPARAHVALDWLDRRVLWWRRQWYAVAVPGLQFIQPKAFLFSLLVFLLLVFNGQCREIFVILIERSGDAATTQYSHLFFGLLSCSILAWVLFSNYMASTSSHQSVVYGQMSRSLLAPWLRSWRLIIAFLCAMAPFMGVAVGFFVVRAEGSDKAWSFLLFTMLWGASVAGLLWRGRQNRQLRTFSRAWLPGVVAAMLTLLLFVGGKALVGFARCLGPLAIIGLQLLAAYVTIAIVAWLMRGRWRLIPRLAALWLLALLSVWLVERLIDQSKSSQSESTEHASGETPRLEEAYRAWLEPRLREHGSRGSGRFPVFLVAAEGGGIYAASAVATFLAHMRDKETAFARHLFAVSGVSGGAVGAALYSGSKDTAELRKSLRQDHLSPVLSVMVPEIAFTVLSDLGGLIAHPLHRATALLPIHPPGWWASMWREVSDVAHKGLARRASLLAESLLCCSTGTSGNSGRSHSSGLVLAEPIDAHWRRGGHALILNTTHAESADTVAFAPFRLSDLNDTNITAFADHDYAKEVATLGLANAAVASAGFPLVLPPMRLPTKAGVLNFVDGGYADNSGVAVASALFGKLREWSNKDEVDLRLILLTSETRHNQKREYSGLTLFVDIVVPIQALLNVRARAGPREVARVINQFAQRSADAAEQPVLSVSIGKDFFLGWTISQRTIGVIECDLGIAGSGNAAANSTQARASACHPRDSRDGQTTDASAARENAAVIGRIGELLHAGYGYM